MAFHAVVHEISRSLYPEEFDTAVAKNGQVITMSAAGDALTSKMKIQAISFSHSAAATAILNTTTVAEIARLQVTTSKLTEELVFPFGLIVDGILAQTLSAGVLTVYLAP